MKKKWNDKRKKKTQWDLRNLKKKNWVFKSLVNFVGNEKYRYSPTLCENNEQLCKDENNFEGDPGYAKNLSFAPFSFIATYCQTYYRV